MVVNYPYLHALSHSECRVPLALLVGLRDGEDDVVALEAPVHGGALKVEI